MKLTKVQQQVIKEIKADGKHAVNFKLCPWFEKTYTSLLNKGVVKEVERDGDYIWFDLTEDVRHLIAD